MFFVARTAGHPRDMGHDQGRTLAHAVQSRLQTAGLPLRRRRWPTLAPFTSGSVRGQGVGRETIRHYTHLAERMAGLAQGAGVPLDGVLLLHAGAVALGEGDVETRDAVALSAVGLEDAPGVTIALSVSGASDPGRAAVVRRSRPAVGFESVELTLPWLATALAGVNEAGLAAAIVPVAREPGALPCAPPPILLVQECLQRFTSLDGALDWARRRPAAGFATLLVGDADGARAAVHFAGAARRVERAGLAPQVAGTPARIADALREAAAGSRTLDEKALCPPDDALAPPAYVRIVATRRSLELCRPGTPREELLLQI